MNSYFSGAICCAAFLLIKGIYGFLVAAIGVFILAFVLSFIVNREEIYPLRSSILFLAGYFTILILETIRVST